MRRILIVAAHPDDEVLGCGGTAARLVKEGNKVFSLILGEGITSRDDTRETKKNEDEIKALKEQAEKANKILGIEKTFLFDFPDNRFDTVQFLDIVKTIERIKKELKPEMILTHYGKDLNIDHQIVYKAVVTATRPLSSEIVKEIYSFEVLSSTEWNYPLSFSPDTFFDISRTIDLKLKAMSQYRSELRGLPHPRSSEGIKLNASNWGMKVGLEYAEAFKSIRTIR
jgi:LmbE family N-acetylglucosaminyl deacetylase